MKVHCTPVMLTAALGIALLVLGLCPGCGGGGGGAITPGGATVQGRVVDVATLGVQAQAVGVQGAKITLRPTGGGASHSDTTDTNGGYSIGGVPGGSYYVFVTPPSGYAPPSDPDADPNNGIATIIAPSSGTLVLADIALAIDPDAPPGP